MVANKYRWDFVGLSTDEKPTASNSEKVVDGSTYYCADTSKLYVWCGSQWYEKTAIGGGGGIPTDVIDSFWFGTQAQYDAIETKANKTLYLIQETATQPVTLNMSRSSETIIEKTDVVTPIENEGV